MAGKFICILAVISTDCLQCIELLLILAEQFVNHHSNL